MAAALPNGTYRVHDAADDLVDDLVERAREAIAGLDAHLVRITATRDGIAAFLATIQATPKPTIAVPPPAVAPATVAQIAEQVTAKPAPKATKDRAGAGPGKRKRAPMALVKCPHCDFECTPPNMWRHTKSKHGPTATQLTGPPSDPTKTPPTPPRPRRTVLACSECDATFPFDKPNEMSRHTIQVHRRGPLTIERTPVAA
jgi:hypothetical protein